MSYATLSDARDEGITTLQANDVRLQRLLDAATARIDEVTGWWFDPRALTLTFDGHGGEVLPLPAPVVTLTSVAIDATALDLATVHVYGTVAAPRADVRYPRLARASSLPGYRVGRAPVWPRGRKNVVVVGSFGFVEANGTSPPAAIREACLRLAIRALPLLTDASGQEDNRRGEIEREATDGHSYGFGSSLPGAVGAWRRGGLTGDPVVDVLLAGYRRTARSAVACGAAPAPSGVR